jgi:hypothetical protein
MDGDWEASMQPQRRSITLETGRLIPSTNQATRASFIALYESTLVSIEYSNSQVGWQLTRKVEDCGRDRTSKQLSGDAEIYAHRSFQARCISEVKSILGMVRFWRATFVAILCPLLSPIGLFNPILSEMRFHRYLVSSTATLQLNVSNCLDIPNSIAT